MVSLPGLPSLPSDHHRSGPAYPADRAPKRMAPHLHHTAQHAHQVVHISMGLLPAVAVPTGIQKGEEGLGLGLASGSRQPPSSVLSLQEPLGGKGGFAWGLWGGEGRGGEGQGGGGCMGHSGPCHSSLLIPGACPHPGLYNPPPHTCSGGPALHSAHILGRDDEPREAMGESASLCPGPTCSIAMFLLSLRKLNSWGPSAPHTSWMSFNRASSWKVRFTCGGGGTKRNARPALSGHSPPPRTCPPPPASPDLLHCASDPWHTLSLYLQPGTP